MPQAGGSGTSQPNVFLKASVFLKHTLMKTVPSRVCAKRGLQFLERRPTPRVWHQPADCIAQKSEFQAGLYLASFHMPVYRNHPAYNHGQGMGGRRPQNASACPGGGSRTILGALCLEESRHACAPASPQSAGAQNPVPPLLIGVQV